jgi:hypothetical protein
LNRFNRPNDQAAARFDRGFRHDLCAGCFRRLIGAVGGFFLAAMVGSAIAPAETFEIRYRVPDWKAR